MMKKSFWVALATIALMTGCSSDENVPVAVNDGANAIEFSVYKGGKTRVIDMDIDKVQAKHVFFCAHQENGTSLGESLRGELWYTLPTVDASVKTWLVYSATAANHIRNLYWPIGYDALDFYACVPTTLTTLEDGHECKEITFATTAAQSTQEDLLVAHTRATKAENMVTFNLVHALSKINFTWDIYGDDNTDGIFYQLEKLVVNSKINGTLVNEKGTLTWTPTGASAETTLLNETSPSTTGIVAPVTLDKMILIPGQTLNCDITYTVWQDQQLLETRTLTNIEIGDNTNTENGKVLKPSNQYTFNLVPSYSNANKPIRFDVQLTEWNDAGTQIVNI